MEEKKKINEEEMKKISGGNMLWGRTCKICGGVINNDPNTPYDIRCHCKNRKRKNDMTEKCKMVDDQLEQVSGGAGEEKKY